MRDSVHAVRQSMIGFGRPPPIPPKQRNKSPTQNHYPRDSCTQAVPLPSAPVSSHKVPTAIVAPTKTRPAQTLPHKKPPPFDFQTATLKSPGSDKKLPQTPPIPADRPPAAIQLASLMRTKRDNRESRYVYFIKQKLNILAQNWTRPAQVFCPYLRDG